GLGWDQEDDVTLVTLKRTVVQREQLVPCTSGVAKNVGMPVLSDFTVERKLGNERPAIARVAHVIESLGLQPGRVEAVKTAVAEAITNAIEHADDARPDLPVSVRVLASAAQVTVAISNAAASPTRGPTPPNLLAKLDGREQPRGWGLFLMKRLADEVNVIHDADHYTVELS